MAYVLVVDNDPGQREMLRLLLEEAGHIVSEADSGDGALDILRSANERLVVLLDQRMPGLGGDEVLRVAADDHTLATRHVYILVTASPQHLVAAPPDVITRLNVPIVEKPFDMDTLLLMVEQAAARLTAP
jgi:two-component system, NtrC family, response regulator HydG